MQLNGFKLTEIRQTLEIKRSPFSFTVFTLKESAKEVFMLLMFLAIGILVFSSLVFYSDQNDRVSTRADLLGARNFGIHRSSGSTTNPEKIVRHIFHSSPFSPGST